MLGLEHTEWKEQGSCVGMWREFDYDNDTVDVKETTILRRICGQCPVREQCAEDALEYSDEYTFRAGMTPRERKILMKHLGIPSWENKQKALREAKYLPENEHKAGSIKWMNGCNCRKCSLVPDWYRRDRKPKK